MKHFDPLLFNELGSERERRWNHILYGFLGFFGYCYSLVSGSLCGIYIIRGLENEDYEYCGLLYVVMLFSVFIYFIVWLYIHILIFRHTKQNKHIDKSNPLLICEYQGSFKNYCVWTLEFIAVFILCLILLILSFIAPPFFIAILFLLYLYKPFLLKRILLFEEYVILEYRIFGNMKLSREGLALMRLNRLVYQSVTDYISNFGLVRPMIVKDTKEPYLIYYPCTIFSIYGMTNVDILRQELDSKMGYSAEKLANENIFYTQKKIFNVKLFTIYLKEIS